MVVYSVPAAGRLSHN